MHAAYQWAAAECCVSTRRSITAGSSAILLEPAEFAYSACCKLLYTTLSTNSTVLLAGSLWVYAGTAGARPTAAAPLAHQAAKTISAARYSTSYLAATTCATPGK